MESEEPSYKELQCINSFLTNEINKHIASEFDYALIRNQLDSELERFRFIQQYSQEAITIENVERLFDFTVKSIIKTFEVEKSLVLVYNEGMNSFEKAAEFGFNLPQLQIDYNDIFMPFLQTVSSSGAQIFEIHPGMHPWDEMDLHQIIIAPFFRYENRFGGIVLAGRTIRNKDFYDEFTDNLIAPFTVFGQQFTSIVKNLDLRINNQDHINKMSTLHTIGATISSILNEEKLSTKVVQLVVEELGYQSATMFLFDEKKKTLDRGKCAVLINNEVIIKEIDNDENAVKNNAGEILNTSIREVSDGFAGTALTGKPCVIEEGQCRAHDSAILRIAHAKSMYIFPLMVGSRVIGVMAVALSGSSNTISERDCRLLTTLADQVAASLENTRLVKKNTMAERLSAIGEMAAGIAHELRNPLSAIGTLIDVLEMQTNGGDPMLFRGIKEESRRLENIITRFLTFTRQYTPELEPHDLNIILEEIVSILEKDPQHRKTVFTLELDRSIGPVHIDGDGIKRVLWNVILNGLQAIEGEGGITVRSVNGEENITVQIHDTGRGIPEDIRDRIFEPFFTEKEKGTGLGLPLADKVIKAHGGVIAVESERNSGTLVSITIPK